MGDPVALGELFEQFAAPTWQVLVRLLGSRADADDALQDVFVGLPEALARYTGRGRLGAWIRQVAVRVALMRLRSGRRRGETPLDESADALTLRMTLPPPIELRLAIRAAVASLPAEFRAVFVLKEIEGYSHAEIAEMMDISVGLSEVRLCRARKHLRTLLSDRETS
jgi:RNA polymerase sigma-70 factor (ECF subfamily)